MEANNKLSGKKAIITGGTSGIGKTTAWRFCTEGADVVIIGRSDTGKDICEEINEKIGRKCCYFCKYDLTDLNHIDSIINFAKNTIDGIDILVNNAGIFKTKLLDEISVDDYRSVLDINLGSMIFLCKSCMPYLIESKGNIVNVASIGGLQSHIAGRSQYLYGASKAGAIEFSQLLALNYAPEVRVNCVCPGPTDTPLYKNRDFSRMTNNIPLHRMGTPEDCANAITYLASDEASYITGAIITVDGGASLC